MCDLADDEPVELLGRGNEWSAFTGWSGVTVAELATDVHGVAGGAVGYQPRGLGSAHVLLGSLAAVYAAFTLIYFLAGGVVRELELPGGAVRVPTRHPVDLAIFSLLVMTAGSPAGGLQPGDDLTLSLIGVQAFLGIALTGLLGFVLGNRIRR